MYILDPKSKIPLHIQLYEEIKKQIISELKDAVAMFGKVWRESYLNIVLYLNDFLSCDMVTPTAV